ncbi:MAG: 1-deoxy-D-xylulose-5-phosphate synthase [Puniceicoccales bacterium]|jgi:1-deoxy-D-xylulose-5-phosphate synthase|nr:1-deoxy-D-xylulose-5-phosphate synthase [Puniceicoccales bacterium]
MAHGGWEEWEALAAALRRRIVAVAESNGGHLASNLGVVELTVALHRCFQFPPDRLVPDVSHQCYAHKLLTGRDGRAFDLLRREGGHGGFCDGGECPVDPFLTGHAGTALSSALGLAVARDRRGGREHVVALLGDGTLNCGLTLEALQHATAMTGKLVVVLNDNGWTIDGSVGSIAALLAIPEGGANFFQKAYAMDYLGPVDGHRFAELVPALEMAKNASRPVLVHVRSTKGKGHPAAERDPARYHKVSPGGGPQGYGQTLGHILCSCADGRDDLVAISAAMADGTGLRPFAERFPRRFFDVGIAEGHALTFAAGLARGGLYPVCALYSTFFHRAVDSLFHDVCLQDLPLTLCLDRAGPASGDGDTHHGLFDIALAASFPNLTVAQPASPGELDSLLRLAIGTPHPFLIRYEFHGAEDGKDFSGKDIGKTAAVVRAGDQISIWALGQRRLEQALEVAELLEGKNIAAEVVNARFVRPLDLDRLRRSARCPLLVTLEDHVVGQGFGSRVALELAAGAGHCQLLAIGWPFPIGFAESIAHLERRWQQTPRDLFRRILRRYGQLPSASPRPRKAQDP